MGSLAIETRHLRKVFGSKVAVEDLSLEVQRGEVFGFLGPNGAGKSTSVKMLLALVKPTDGEASVLGRRPGDVEARAKIGFLPEHFRFHSWLTAEEFLLTHGRLYNMQSTRLKRRVDELLELVGLGAHRKLRIGTFSKGMTQRIGLAQALLNEPELVFLDEPTSGLDPGGRLLVRDIIRHERSRGTAIFLNSHLLGEVEVTCDRVAFVKHGEVLELAGLDELTAEEIHVTVRAKNLCPDASAGLEQWCDSVDCQADQLELVISDEAVLPDITRHLVGHGAEIYSIAPERATLEQKFLEIIGPEGGL